MYLYFALYTMYNDHTLMDTEILHDKKEAKWVCIAHMVFPPKTPMHSKK